MSQMTKDQLQQELSKLKSLQSQPRVSRHSAVTQVNPKEFRAYVTRRVVKFKRPKVQPLTTFDDKLALCENVTSRREYNTRDSGLELHLIVWDVPYDEDKIRHIVSITVTSEVTMITNRVSSPPAKRLITTQYGRVCPQCKTNEYLRSTLDFYTNTIKAVWSRSKSELNEYCAKCGSISTDGLDPIVKSN